MAHKPRTHPTTLFRLSHSSVETLEKCPYQWMQRYIKFNYPDIAKPATEFGSLCHKIAELYAGGDDTEIPYLIHKYISDYTFPPEYDAKLPEAIGKIRWFYDTYLKNAKTVLREKEVYTDLNMYFDFSGSFDVLYKDNNNNWTIVDYKTSKKVGNYRMQMATYFFILSITQKKIPETIRVQVVYLANNTSPEECIHEYVLDLSDIKMAENRLLNAIDTIAQYKADESLWIKRKTVLCGWCDYYMSGDCEGYTKPKVTYD